MTSDQSAVTAAYLEHLGDVDLALLTGRDHRSPEGRELRSSLLNRRGGIADLLAGPQVARALFGSGRQDDPLMWVSPFFVFAVAIHQTVRQLESVSYVAEWAGVGRRTPVFDVASLRDFSSSPWRRFFLAELLSSYTHVASGSIVVPTRRGWRRYRFSELDPVRLAGLLELADPSERPGVLRRLGDLSLFLTGVFPDYLARRGFGPIQEGRLLKAGRMETLRPEPGPGGMQESFFPGDGHAVALMEQLGRRWYEAAFELMPRPVPSTLAVLGELPKRFHEARRILAMVTERFLFGYRDRWFGAHPA
jgi:hypothetical protein